MDGNKQLAELLFPKVSKTVADLETLYPKRDLPEGAMVTRIAPSPTGFFHIGTLGTALISERLAHQSGGVFFLRIEDTDQSRQVEGAQDLIISALERYLILDEGPTHTGQRGYYGPYIQSQRLDSYHTLAKHLVSLGHAYPCFATKEELEKLHQEQVETKLTPGVYGQFAPWRNKSLEEIKQALNEGKQFVIRLKSTGNPDKRFKFKDLAKGEVELPQNHLDAVLLKSDGFPTYHFAHLVDDYLMRVTHIVRTDEWFSSLPLHLELFAKAGLPAPKYCHASPIQKMDGESRRKLSKRKDPEANIEYYWQQGYPNTSILEYLINISNSNFQNWRPANLDKSLFDYPFQVKGLTNQAGALLDVVKLDSIAKDVVARMSAKQIFEEALIWANQYDPLIAKLLADDSDYALKIFNIEREGGKPRKDIGKWNQLHFEIGFFFDELFKQQVISIPQDLIDFVPQLVSYFLDLYQGTESKEDWLQIMIAAGQKCGFASNKKEFDQNPNQFKGHLGTTAQIFRLLLTGRNQTPDLYEIIQVLGIDRVKTRLTSHV